MWRVIKGCISIVLCIAVMVTSYAVPVNIFSSTAAAESRGIVGDLDGDGVITGIDLSLIKQYLVGMIKDFPVEDDLWAGDLDGSGTIDALDFALMKQYLLKMIKVFPKEQPTVPANLTCTRKTMSLLDLKWDSSTDNSGQACTYDIHLKSLADGHKSVFSTGMVQTSIFGLNPDTSYEILVYAKSVSGNVSTASNLLTVKTNSLAEDTVNAQTLQLNVPLAGSINKVDFIYYNFTPSANGTYDFFTTGSDGTCGKLYDKNGAMLAYKNSDISNFKISYKLKANLTYYLMVSLSDWNQSRSFNVNVTKQPQASEPVFSLASGSYDKPQTLTISCNTPGAKIYYTTNGNTPTVNDSVYTVPIPINGNMTIKAYAVLNSILDSEVSSAVYTIAPKMDMPAIYPDTGTYHNPVSVTIAPPTSGAIIRYTLDGTTPTSVSAKYSGPINITNSATLKAYASMPGMTDSDIASATYTIIPKIEAPIITGVSDGNVYPAAVTPAWNDISGASITATLNGSPYTRGTPVAAEGVYTLIVTAEANGMTNQAAAVFAVTSESVSSVRANDQEEFKNALANNFASKGAQLVIAYNGDASSMPQTIEAAVKDVLATDTDKYKVKSYNYNYGGYQGNAMILLSFVYEDPEQGVSTIEEIKTKLIEGLKVKSTMISLKYSGDMTDFSNKLDALINAAINEEPNMYEVSNWHAAYSGYEGYVSVKISFQYKQIKGISTIEGIQPKLVEGLKANSDQISVTYTGDTADLANKLNELLASTINGDPNGYNVSSRGFIIQGETGKLTIVFTFKYYSEPTETVNTIDEIKAKLIEGLIAKTTKITLKYTGDSTDLSSKLSEMLSSVLNGDENRYYIATANTSTDGTAGDITVSFALTYKTIPTQQADAEAASPDELKSVLTELLNSWTADFKILYKGDTANIEDTVKNALQEILDNDPYLKRSISYSTKLVISEQTALIEFNVKYATTKSQEDFINNKVNLIISDIITPEMNVHEKEKAIHDYILLNVDYDYSLKNNNAYTALYYGKTICNGYALLTYKMLKAAGIDSTIVSGQAGGGSHGWNQVNIDGKWYNLDCTWDDADFVTDYYKYYNLTNDQMAADHTWDTSTGKACTTDYRTELNDLASDPDIKSLLSSLKDTEGDFGVHDPQPSIGVQFLYNDILLKEGETSDLLFDTQIPDNLDSEIQWISSDSSVADVIGGTLIAKKAGHAFITARFKNNTGYSDICSVEVLPFDSGSGKTFQALEQSKLSVFDGQSAKPVVNIFGDGDVNANTTVTDCYNDLNCKVDMIGHPIEIKTTSQFDWAEIGFKVDDSIDAAGLNDLTICWYDEANNIIVPQATRIDYENKIIYATVSHFSKYYLTYKNSTNKKQINIACVVDTKFATQDSVENSVAIAKSMINSLISKNEYNINVYCIDTTKDNVQYFTSKQVADTDALFKNLSSAENIEITSDNKAEAENIVQNKMQLGSNILNNEAAAKPLKNGRNHNFVIGFLNGYWYYTENIDDDSLNQEKRPIARFPNNNTALLVCDNSIYFKGKLYNKSSTDIKNVLPDVITSIFEINNTVKPQEVKIMQNGTVIDTYENIIIANDSYSMDDAVERHVTDYSGKILVGTFSATGEEFLATYDDVVICSSAYDIDSKLQSLGIINYDRITIGLDGITFYTEIPGAYGLKQWGNVNRLSDLVKMDSGNKPSGDPYDENLSDTDPDYSMDLDISDELMRELDSMDPMGSEADLVQNLISCGYTDLDTSLVVPIASTVPSIEKAHYGKRSTNVFRIQQTLQKMGYWTDYSYSATGLFGKVTKASLINFQKNAMHLTDNDLYDSKGHYVGCGPKTAAALSKLYDKYVKNHNWIGWNETMTPGSPYKRVPPPYGNQGPGIAEIRVLHVYTNKVVLSLNYPNSTDPDNTLEIYETKTEKRIGIITQLRNCQQDVAGLDAGTEYKFVMKWDGGSKEVSATTQGTSNDTGPIANVKLHTDSYGDINKVITLKNGKVIVNIVDKALGADEYIDASKAKKTFEDALDSYDTITLAAAIGAQKWIDKVISDHNEFPEFAWIEPKTPEYYVWAYVKMQANIGYLVAHDKLDKLILDLCGVAMLTYETVGLAAKIRALPIGRTVVIDDIALKTVAEALGRRTIRVLDTVADSALANRVKGIRSMLPSNPRNYGNMAYAKAEIPGVKAEMFGHSRIDILSDAGQSAPNIEDIVSLKPTNPVFKATEVPTSDGTMLLRDVDGEFKILNDIANQLGNNTSFSGKITLYTDRVPCASCENVILEFLQKYKNITIDIIHNNNVILKP